MKTIGVSFVSDIPTRGIKVRKRINFGVKRIDQTSDMPLVSKTSNVYTSTEFVVFLRYL